MPRTFSWQTDKKYLLPGSFIGVENSNIFLNPPQKYNSTN